MINDDRLTKMIDEACILFHVAERRLNEWNAKEMDIALTDDPGLVAAFKRTQKSLEDCYDNEFEYWEDLLSLRRQHLADLEKSVVRAA
jgi:hypothetical protein